MKKCDVIIPIYNAYDDVIECIESVLKNTKFDGNKLILIDDKSPDERIQPMLKEYANKYKKEILFLTNEVNKGFVGTVNRGMKESKNDVVLLNSDTEVTPRWLDKMIECAYSSDDIATVTPLSNNATLASVPKIFEPNDLPEGMSLDEMGELVEKCSYNHYPEIPTCHGFCAYIKREALDKVGYFDEESYGRGYGEENDFSFRCYEYGYRNVLCDNTYILHKESKSFLDSKTELIADGLRVLEEKYPHYKHQLDVWVQNRPIEYIGNNIALAIGNREARPNIMYVIHDWKDIKNNLGGTTLHVWDLIKNMRDKYNFHIFAPEDGIYKVYSYFKDQEMVAKYPSISINMTMVNNKNSEYRRLLEQIVDEYKISYVHIHHMIGHYFDIVDVLKEKNIKYMVTLHDFYCQCPLINKIYKHEEYCGMKPEESKCSECLNCIYKTNIDIKSWRNQWSYLLENADHVITPSKITKEEINAIFKNINIKVIEHGIDIEKEESNLTVSDKVNDIAFIGAIGYHKGSRLLEELIKTNRMKNVRIHLFGKIDSQYGKNNKHFINHGKYHREELKDLLKKNNIKLICLFSIWPETYSYTMTEAIACGIPVISFDFGAIAERIHKYNLGWTIPFKSNYDEITTAITNVFKDEDKYNNVIKSINKYKIITTKEMSKNYVDIYSKNAKEKGLLSDNIKDNLAKNRVFSTYVSYSDYSWVFSTLKWRIISIFKIPRSIKRLFRKR